MPPPRPPRPQTAAGRALLAVTFAELLEQKGLGILLPFFYNFFVMQGMGRWRRFDRACAREHTQLTLERIGP